MADIATTPALNLKGKGDLAELMVAADLRSFYGSLVFETTIPRNVRLAEAPSYGKPVIYYDQRSRGAEAYSQLAEEVVANEQKTAGPRIERADLDRFAASGR